ncbi:hypothetical protein Q8G42_02810 [Acinetobacter lwoffii]|jgi:hypothetical protein|uniref:Uncharacterized protein n=1 Tax=Acinetobacter lwoffii TaxID=28090 RepID=A0A6N1MFQ2_ACILW|nr:MULTISPECIES: hypothetical protein [Acinetobacter]EEY89482.1 hypothetical protein HMPREF0017_01786 [Acinetobacter lwoffii SH145]ENX26705.1 hypothetical protein F891_02396 [Acinetobacter sp. CIP 101966]MDP1316664.1 hypothetical protein [Acinetobacter lwoffii]MDP1369755.1 hypothetical protein [Acinetobacter lwoffii]MDP1389154.1 hypothetical protein [Acinetobacter lwoffii]
MHLSTKTLEKLRDLINEITEYRSGPKIIDFFGMFDYQDVYGQGFPSRWMYTDLRLSQINGTPKLDICIKNLFNPINYIEDLNRLDNLIKEFNKYLQFDKYQITRTNTEINLTPITKINLDEQFQSDNENIENNFIKHEFKFDCSQLNLIPTLMPVIKSRIIEIEKAFKAEAYLSVVLLAGSTLEGIFLNIASLNPRVFNTSNCSPKKDGKVKNFDQWTLHNFIEVSHSINLIEKDTYRFSKELRDFRNYIHPFQQMTEKFSPREQTAKICLQVLKSAISDIQTNQNKIGA